MLCWTWYAGFCEGVPFKLFYYIYKEVAFVGSYGRPMHATLKNKLFFHVYTILHLKSQCIFFFPISLSFPLPLQIFYVRAVRNFSHRLTCLNTWSQVDGAIWGSPVMLGEVYHWGQILSVCSLTSPSVCLRYVSYQARSCFCYLVLLFLLRDELSFKKAK